MLAAPVVKELVLLGGGHSHVEVLRSWGMRPVAGVRLTLITRDMHTPYSGMLPGYVSGFYGYDECHIDLCRLATFARARLIHAEAQGIDIRARRVLLPDRPAVRYDALSIDIGITPAAATVPGAAQHTTAVKPIDRFVARFDALLARARSSPHPISVAVVGGGAGGVELALAVQYRLEQERQQQSVDGVDKVKIFCRCSILSDHPGAAATAIRQICLAKGIELHEQASVTSVEAGRLLTDDGGWHQFDECLWCTQAAAAHWLRDTGLPTDPRGFLLINKYLQSCGGPPEVFAAGDVATSAVHPRPKAGVYAVRQGPPLAANLRAYVTGDPLQPFTPQKQALALISTGNKYAVGTRGWLTFQGEWAWTWKDGIDRKFMDKYGAELPFGNMTLKTDMSQTMLQQFPAAGQHSSSSIGSWWHWITSLIGWNSSSSSSNADQQQQQWQQQLPGAYRAAGSEGIEVAAAAAIRCGGCGSKVGASTLQRVLRKVTLQQQQQQQQEEEGRAVQCKHGLDMKQPTVAAAAAVVDVQASACTAAAAAAGCEPTKHGTSSSSSHGNSGSSSSRVLLGVGDDAAVTAAPPAGHVLVSTIDYFRTFWPDAYVLGAIAANHALGDCYAMGASPTTALALAVVPHGSAAYQESELTDMLSGALKVLKAAGCELVGGHTSEGLETSAGFSITGHVHPAGLMTKSALSPGDVLILTKPLGTGTLMAAAMRGQAKGRWVSNCLSAMQVSSAGASEVLKAHGCSAATDVTGFGLLGHAVEMARASKVQIELSLSSIPALEGALECLSCNITSSLHDSNVKAAAAALVGSDNSHSRWSSDDTRFQLMCDPQTAGGLLAGVASAEADRVLDALRTAGFSEACAVGRVVGRVEGTDVDDDLDLIDLVEIVD